MSRTSRRWLVISSVTAHAALAGAFWLSGAWRLDRLEADNRFTGSIAVMLPPPAPSGGPVAAKATMPEKKPPPKQVVKEPVQPVEHAPPQVAQTATAPTGGTGDGTGPGTGSGDPSASGTCTDPNGCGEPTAPPALPVCGNGVRETGEQCDDGNRSGGDGCSATCATEAPPQATVTPTVLAGLRISGETQVHPSDVVKTAILRDGKERVAGTLKLCVSAAGDVSSASVVGSTHYPAYDAALVSAAREWRYRPYSVSGRPVPVCGMVTFIYAIK